MIARLKEVLKRFPRLAYSAGEASNALNLLLLAVLARLLGVEPYGDLMAVMAAAGILGELIEFGYPILIVRVVARDRAAAWHELRHALARQALMCLPMLLILYGYMRLSNMNPEMYGAGLLIGASIGFRSLKATVRGVCRAIDRFVLEAAFLWAERIGLLAFCLLALGMGGGLKGVAWAFFLTRAVDFAAYVAAVRSALGKNIESPPLQTPIAMAAALPFAVTGLLWSLYYQVDAAMLLMLSTPRDTGLYGGLYRFVDILAVLPRLIIVVAYPVMARVWTENRGEFGRLFGKLERRLTVIGLPILLALSVGSAPLLHLAFGEEFAAGAGALRLIVVGIYFTFHSMLLSQTLQAAGHEVKLAWGLLGTVAVNVGLNVWLIPEHGFMGAAISTVATEVLYYAVTAFLALRAGVLARFPVSLPFLVASAALAAVAAFGNTLSALGPFPG